MHASWGSIGPLHPQEPGGSDDGVSMYHQHAYLFQMQYCHTHRSLIMSAHARAMMQGRHIREDRVLDTVDSPERTEEKGDDEAHYLKRISGNENKVLWVLVNQNPISSEGSYGILRSESAPMKVKIDPEADALYMRLSDTRIHDSEEVKPGIILDYDEKNNLVGIEILEP